MCSHRDERVGSFVHAHVRGLLGDGFAAGEWGGGVAWPPPPRARRRREGGPGGGRPSEAQAESASAQHLLWRVAIIPSLSLVNPVHGRNWILFGFSNEF